MAQTDTKRKRFRKTRQEVASILHLPIVERIVHSKARRPITVVSIGVGIMISGSLIASNKETISHLIEIHHVVVDTVGYFIHGIGAIPAIRYIEPFWAILFGGAEEVAEAAAIVAETMPPPEG